MQQAADKPATPLQVKYGNYFAACMNDDLANQLGAKPIQPTLSQIDALKDKAQLAKLVGTLEDKEGVALFYGFGSEQDQKDSTKQIRACFRAASRCLTVDYYLQKDARMSGIRDKYVAHMTKMFTLLGDTPEQAAAEAQAVLRISRPPSPRVRCRAWNCASLPTSTTSKRWPSCRRSRRTTSGATTSAASAFPSTR